MNIKKLLLLGITILCCCLQCKESLAQYFVTKVIGRVRFENGAYIKPGTNISLQDKLVFSSFQDLIRTISPNNGSFIFSPTSQAEKKDNLFMQTVAMCTRIHASSGSLSGRGSIVETIPEELNSTKSVVIGNTNQYLFNKRKYPIEGTNKFFLEINVFGSRRIIRTLKTNNDTLTMPYTSFLYSIDKDDQGIRPTTYTLGFLRNGKSEKVIEFSPYFDVTNDLLSIIQTGIRVWDSLHLPVDTLRDKCYTQVYETIGKPNALAFNTVFQNLIHKTDSVENFPYQFSTGYNNEPKAEIKIASNRVASSRSELPTQVTLRQYAPPVGNQGQTGTCTVWASAYAGRTISYATNHFSGTSSLSDSIQKYCFSPEYIYFKIRTANNCDNGTSIYSALTTMKKEGNVPNKVQAGFDCSKSFSSDQTAVANNYGIKDFQSLIDYKDTYKILPDETINKMKQYLADRKAIMIAIQVNASFYRIDKTGIWQPTQEEYDHVIKVKNCLDKNDGTQCNSSGHALCVVGYNNDINGGSFEVMNSWGTDWGNQGFFWMSYKDFAYFGIQAYIMNDYTVTPKKEIVLKGSLEFTEKCGDSCMKEMMVDKIAGGAALARGEKIVDDDVLPANTTIYNFRNNYPSGTRYRMKLHNEGAAYVYVFGYDGRAAYTLFPSIKNNESALIDLQQSSLYIPAIGKSIMLDDNPGIENVCVIVSKDSLNCQPILDSLDKNGKSMNMYKIVTDLIPGRIQQTDALQLRENLIEYQAVVDDKSTLVFFLRMKHI